MTVKNNLGPGLFVGIPTLGRPVPLDWALNFKGMNPPINFNVIYHIVKGKQVADARNEIARAALEKDAKYLFFIGDDTVCPPHTLRQLIYRMENTPNIGVVGGVYCSKSDPPAPLVFKENGGGSFWDWKVGEFFECTGLGMDCTLIRVDVLKKIPEPWFKTVDVDNYLDATNSAECWTEDLFFLRKVLEHTDYKIYCDASVICEHHDVFSGKVYKLPKDSLPMRQKLVTKDKKALVLGPLLDLVDETYDITHASDNGIPCDYNVDYRNLPFDENQFDWIIVTAEQTAVAADWLRVVKPGSKISINVKPIIDKTIAAAEWGGTIDGTFIEIVKSAD